MCPPSKKHFNALKNIIEKKRKMSMDTKVSSTSRRGFLKGMAVGAGGYALGSLLIHPQEAMGQSIEGYLEKVPMEIRWRIASGSYIGWQIMCLQEIYDKRGQEKFLEHFKKMSALWAPGQKQLADRLGFTGNDAKAATAIIPASLIIVYGPKQKYETVEATAEKARIRCVNCELWNAVQARKITDDLCSVHSQYWWDGFVKAMNPKMTSNLVKARPRGDSVCEWVIELKA